MLRYETVIYWSSSDACFIAEVSELPGCIAHGDSYEMALGNL
jgi:predicted RNase H-like HicB family nuclease